MHKRFLLAAAAMVACLHTNAQTEPAKCFKDVNYGNPISGAVFCADPTAIEYEGRLYVYGSNDHQQFIANGKKNKNGYGAIKSLVVLSTDDLVNWTFHGTIDVKKVCSWSGNSWAPSATWRINDQGKPEFFIYFANGASNVGVMKGDSPIGPFKSPRSSPIVNHGMSGVDPCNWLFDPGVVVMENGDAWLSFGGGDPNNQGNDLLPGNARIAKLKKNMTEIDGKAINLPAPYHFEASELNIIGGKFAYTYCSSWRGRNDWSKYQKDKGITVSAPGQCTMCYMVTDDPTNPDSWEYRGDYGPHPGTSENNHSHLQKFNGGYYHIYHSGALLVGMKNAGGVDQSANMYRSICINKVTVNEETQKINRVSLNNNGPAAVKTFNPYQLQEAETMATCGGVMYEHFTNITKNTSVSTLGNDASRNMQVKMSAGSWIMVRNVDFGKNGASRFMFRTKGTGTIELRLGKITNDPVATMEFTSRVYADNELDVDPSVFKGSNKKLFIVFTKATNLQFDAWQFTEDDPTPVVSPLLPEDEPLLFDLQGHRVTNPTRGIYIRDGRKVVIK